VNGVRLVWDGKRSAASRVALPIQVVETINVSRASRGTLYEGLDTEDSWRNQLIWADNAYVLAALTQTLAGEIDLIYIDPPFDSRQDYKVRIQVGEVSADQELNKLQSAIEEKAYRDTWGANVESYLQMLYSRLILLRDLLSDRGSLFLHLAPNVSHLARTLLDELFGAANFRAEIIWKRTTAHADTKDFGGIHDVILCYSKSNRHIWHMQYGPYDDAYVRQYYRYEDADGRRFMSGDLTGAGLRQGATGRPWRGFDPARVGRHWSVPPSELERLDREGRIFYTRNNVPRLKRYLDEAPGQPISDVWTDIQPILSWSSEQLGFDTQKPEALLERIIRSSSDEGSIVLDCFSGSGTTAAVAEKLNRRWVACDIGRFAIHTTRKRLLDIPGCRPFLVANLGRYERQVWQQATTGSQHRAYLDFIVSLYRAEPLHGYTHLHGSLAGRAVHVGSVDAPVTIEEISNALEEARTAEFPGLDVLGWEWEMGLHEIIQEAARERGLQLLLRRIPREVMDPRVVAAGDVVFHELAYLKVDTRASGRDVTVALADFVLPNPELVPQAIRDKVRAWSDYIDYWSVDFTFAHDTFHNQLQAFRSRVNRRLDLEASHVYEHPGEYSILIKVVDIFGNDTTVGVDVKVDDV
jgi:adenine-specific DNA-methyltransferase